MKIIKIILALFLFVLISPASTKEVLFEDCYFDGAQIQAKLHTIIDGFTEKQKRVFHMKYFDNLSFRQISEVLHISESTLKSTYYTTVKIIEEKIFL